MNSVSNDTNESRPSQRTNSPNDPNPSPSEDLGQENGANCLEDSRGGSAQFASDMVLNRSCARQKEEGRESYLAASRAEVEAKPPYRSYLSSMASFKASYHHPHNCTARRGPKYMGSGMIGVTK